MKKVMFALIMFIMAGSVLGSGFVLPYMKDGKMPMHKGGNEAVWVILQNGQNRTYMLEVTQTKGKEIAYLMNDTQQLMPPYTYDRKIYFNITIPKNATVGHEWEIGFTVKSIDPDAEGMLTFATQVGGGFSVVVVEDPNQFKWQPWHTLLIVLGIVLLGGLGYFGFRAINKRKDDKRKSQDPLESL